MRTAYSCYFSQRYATAGGLASESSLDLLSQRVTTQINWTMIIKHQWMFGFKEARQGHAGSAAE